MRSLALCLALLPAACGGDATTRSATIELTLNVRSNDVDGDGTVVDSKPISSEPGDPWAAFIADARDAFGAEPGLIVVGEARLALAPSSTNVDDLAQIFHGPVSVELRMDSSRERYDVAEAILDSAELGVEADLSVRFRYDDFADGDRDELLDGAFDVLFVGQSGSEFRSLGASADLPLTLGFTASD